MNKLFGIWLFSSVKLVGSLLQTGFQNLTGAVLCVFQAHSIILPHSKVAMLPSVVINMLHVYASNKS